MTLMPLCSAKYYTAKYYACSFVVTILLAIGCSNSGKKTYTDPGKDVDLKYARNISMTELDNGSTLVNLRNPWDTTVNIAKYLLVDKSVELPSSIGDDIKVIRTPIESAITFDGLYASLLQELGAVNAVKGLCYAEYLSNQAIIKSVKNGKIADCGASISPNMEKIISLKPDAVLISPLEDNDGASRFSTTGISVVYTLDYMESTPLGRAEWIRFYGRLFGKAQKADSIFASVEKKYIDIRKSASTAENHPTVLFDLPYSGLWDVPTSGSVTGRLIEDAGGKNPFSNMTQGGSAHLAPEKVLYFAQDANIWLIRHTFNRFNLSTLEKENRMFKEFKPVKTKAIYEVNTLHHNLFEDGAFHPEVLLLEYSKIFHPELFREPTKYFKPIE